MRPRPLVPSSRRTLATLATLLISAALSLGFTPLPAGLGLGEDISTLALGGEPCDLEKVAMTDAAITTASPATSSIDPVAATPSSVASTPRPAEKIPTVGRAVTVPMASPVGLLQTCPGVRPGGLAITEQEGGGAGLCTYNFVFTDGIHRYIGTAGHCAIPTPTLSDPRQLPAVERSWPVGAGPVASDGQGNKIGRFVYARRQLPLDFALVRVDDRVPVDPAMCYFGGPTGINDDLADGPEILHFYGNGIVTTIDPSLDDLRRSVAPARSALALDMSDPNEVTAHGPAVLGDSGAGVISADGRAVGNISALSIGTSTVFEPLSIPRIGPQIARAEQVLGLNLELVTAPLQ
ncbi:MAG: hypothetical protein ABR592_03560 [Nitriliruptorales bacterium]